MKNINLITTLSLIATTSSLNAAEVKGIPLQAVRPQDVLADHQNSITARDGTELRKGTVKATIENIKTLNALFKLSPSPQRQQKIAEMLTVIDELLTPLHHIELFEFFTPYEWLQDAKNQGRILVTLRYLSLFKEKMTPEIKHQLTILVDTSEPEVRQRIHELMPSAT